MDVALSKNGRRVLRVFFGSLVVFLYAPIAILLIFSFNDSQLPSFPLSGFTTRWYHQFLTNPDLRGALATSAFVAAVSSIGAVFLGVLASIALVPSAPLRSGFVRNSWYQWNVKPESGNEGTAESLNEKINRIAIGA